MKPRYQILLTKNAAIGWLIVFILLAVSPFIASSFSAKKATAAEIGRSCADLRAAGINPQKLYESDTLKYKRLDRDHNGIACQ